MTSFMVPNRFLVFACLFNLILPASAANAGKVLHAEIKESKVQIIDAEHRHLGYATKKDATGKDQITNVHPGSAAYYCGLREGDTIVDEKMQEAPNGLQAHLTLQRDGKSYQIDLNAPGDFHRFLNGDVTATDTAPKQQPKAEAKAAGAAVTLQGNEQQSDLALAAHPPEPAPTPSEEAPPAVTLQAKTEKVFKGRDLVVLIDRSGSMDTTDCPGASSRWDWCKEQVVSLSNATRSLFPTGFKLGLYNNHCDLSDNADVDAVVTAFTTHKPEGGTYTADAITHQLRDYRERKRHGDAKPMVIIVVTDGAPNSPSALRDVLVNATTDMEQADEVQVVFIQIGEDDQSTTLLDQLERHLTDAGARFPIVHAVTFDKVKDAGLLRSITDVLASNPG